MNVALQTGWTLARFLEWEERQELRYEFDGFQPVAMTGGTVADGAIQANLLRSLGNLLAGKPCRAFGSHVKIEAAGRIRYPDAFVICTPVAASATVVTEPVVVFEILSDSTANEDLVVKNAEYRATPSIQHYVILQQTHAGATLFTRRSPDWLADPITGDDAKMRLPAIGIEIPLAEIYTDIIEK